MVEETHEPVHATEGDASEPGAARRQRQQGPVPARKRGILLVIPLVMAGGAVVALVLGGFKDKGIYAKPVDELVQEASKYAGKAVRAEGDLVHGSLVKRDSPCEYRFTIQRGEVQVPVRYAQCIVPDTFRDVAGMDVSVTVEGKLLADNSFEATSVLAKCPSKYEMRERQQNGEAMPHAVPGM